MPAKNQGRIRVGIGGWNYGPWRKTFYPPGTPQTRELEYASQQVTSIEINGTFYRLQKPEVFGKWHDATPKEFMFSVKAPRFIVQRKDLSSAGTAVERFLASGIDELRSKLGPILWQLSPTKQFDAQELDRFLDLLPARVKRLPLRHALEIRHASFLNREFLDIARRHRVAVVSADDAAYPASADLTSSFVYARLRRSAASVATRRRPGRTTENCAQANDGGDATRGVRLFHQRGQRAGPGRRAEAHFDTRVLNSTP